MSHRPSWLHYHTPPYRSLTEEKGEKEEEIKGITMITIVSSCSVRIIVIPDDNDDDDRDGGGWLLLVREERSW